MNVPLPRESLAKAVATMVMKPKATAAEIAGHGRPSRVQLLRDRHHMIARMVVSGMPHEEVCRLMGMRMNTLQVLINQTPAFAELLHFYKDQPLRMGEVEEYLDLRIRNMTAMELIIAERIENDPDKISFADALRYSADTADRVGFSKHTVSHIVNETLKDRLEGMRRRTSRGAAAGAADGGGDVRAVTAPAPPLLELKANSVPAAPHNPPGVPTEPVFAHPTPSPSVSNPDAPMSREEVLARHRQALENRRNTTRPAAPVVGRLKRRI